MVGYQAYRSPIIYLHTNKVAIEQVFLVSPLFMKVRGEGRGALIREGALVRYYGQGGGRLFGGGRLLERGRLFEEIRYDLYTVTIFNGSIQSPIKNSFKLSEHLHKRQNPTQTDSIQASFAWNCSSHLPSFELERFDRFARLRAVYLLL